MDTTARETQVAEQPARVAASVRHSRRRRRPSGAPPPLPRHLETTGVVWLLAAVGLVTVFVVSFAASRHGAAVAVSAADDRVVRWLAGLRSGWLAGPVTVAAFPASWLASKILAWCIVVPLLVFRRLRHLVVYVVALAVTSQLVLALSAALKRPRPFGVVIDGSWNGYSLPSIQVAVLAASLVSILYALVPEGRWRQTGKWAATAIVALAGLARVALGLDAPTDVLLGAVIGVTIPLLAFRWFTPNEVFPVSYRRGRSAHLDVGGARGQAIRRALQDQLGLESRRSSRSGWPGRPGRPRCGSRSRATRARSCSASCTPAAICVRTAGTSSAGSCCMGGWRTRRPSTPSAGWSSRRTTRSGCCETPACPRRPPTGSSSSPPSAST